MRFWRSGRQSRPLRRLYAAGWPLAGRAARGAAALLVALLAASAPAPAVADSAPGLYLTWNECAASPAASANRSYDCSGAPGGHSLFAAFRLAQPLDSVIAVEVTMDVQHSYPTLPDWWEFGIGGCRQGSLSASAEFAPGAACADFWAGQGTKDPPISYEPGLPRGGASQARIRVAVAVSPESPVRLEADTLYYACRLAIAGDLVAACPGCQWGACIVLNSILIGRLPGAPGGDLVIDTPGPADANWATWQNGVGASCTAVPVRARSWGSLKGLYR